MPKLIKELVAELDTEINSILGTGQEIINDQNGLVYLSCEFNLADVYVLHKKNEKNNNTATEETLQSFIQFTRKMWDSANNTQKIPHLKVNTHINQFNLFLVVKLADLLVPTGIENRSEKINEKIWELLIYTLKRHDFGDVKNIHHYIMSDNNTTMIKVFDCLHEYEMRPVKDKNKKLRHTHPVEGCSEYLSETELQRILNYSPKIKDYYDVIMQDKVDDSLGAKRNTAKKSVNDKNTIIGYSYGIGSKQSGWEKLKYQIYGNIYTWNDYLKRLNRLPEVTWETFSQNIKLSELIKLITSKEEKDYYPSLLPPLMANPDLYSKSDEKHNRAVLFSFFFLYWRKRKVEPNYTGISNYVGFLRMWSSDRDTRCNEAKLILRFIVSQKLLSKFEDFLQSPECKSYVNALTPGYVVSEVLPAMVEQMKKVCSMKLQPEVEQVPVAKYG